MGKIYEDKVKYRKSIYTKKLSEFKYAIKQDLDKKKLSVSHLKGIPQPFIPCFGKEYFESNPRIAFIGRETRGSHMDLLKFVEKKEIETILDLDWFTELKFCEKKEKSNRSEYGNSRNTFFGFVFAVLSEVYDIDDWKKLRDFKKGTDGKIEKILSSFAWGEVNSIENLTSKGITKCDRFAHDIAKKESEKVLDDFGLFMELTDPHVIIIATDNETDDYLIKWKETEEPQWNRKGTWWNKGIENLKPGFFEITYKGKSRIFINLVHPNWQRGLDIFAKDIGEFIKKRFK